MDICLGSWGSFYEKVTGSCMTQNVIMGRVDAWWILGRSWSRLSRGASEFSEVGSEMVLSFFSFFFRGWFELMGLQEVRNACVPPWIHLQRSCVTKDFIYLSRILWIFTQRLRLKFLDRDNMWIWRLRLLSWTRLRLELNRPQKKAPKKTNLDSYLPSMTSSLEDKEWENTVHSRKRWHRQTHEISS